MARFDKIARLAYECFNDKTGYFGWVRVDKSENYIGIVTCKCGDSITDILYDPVQKSAKVITFDPNHFEENRFAELCHNIKVDAKVEFKKRGSDIHGMMGGMARSPSGKVDEEVLRERSKIYSY